jgi:nucleotide-binding universal stress UspA family protein
MYDHIVVPVDGSEAAERAARCGLELARLFDATVDVVHVVERKALGLASTAAETERLRARGQAVLAAVEELAAEFASPVETALRDGKPAERIGAFAAERDADLLVVGRQGMTGLGKRLLGGTTEQLLHRSDVPVFVVPGDATVRAAEWSRLLLPTDGSERAEAAVRHTLPFARRADATVHVLNVVDLQAAGGLFDAGGLEAEFVDRLETRGRDAVERVADALRDAASASAPASAPAVETAVVRTTGFDGAAPGIADYVADNGIDLVVMGSHGRSNLRRQLLGSVASTVLRTVDVPVLVVPRGA